MQQRPLSSHLRSPPPWALKGRRMLPRRLAGDMVHLLSFIVLLLKINATKSCRGISLKTQELYTLVFVCRYLDLFWNFISL